MQRPPPPLALLQPEPVSSGSAHWIDGLTGSLLAPRPHAAAIGVSLPPPSMAAVAAAGQAEPAGALIQVNGPNSAEPLQAAPMAASSVGEPAVLLRDRQPWSQARVDALIAAGTIQARWLPDIRAVAPDKLNIQRQQQRDMLRFSNAIANTGANNWQVRRGVELSLTTDAELIAYAESLGLNSSELALTAQELLNPDGSLAALIPDAALSEFHPEHKHFHIGETAEFGLERRNAQGGWDAITGLEVVKTTFCLIDINQIQSAGSSDPDEYEIIKSPAKDNTYNDCFADVQGITAGWIDRYSHSLPGQEIDITSLAAGTYRLVVNVNPSQWFLESDYSNNTSSVGFVLERNHQGQAFLTQLPDLTSGIWFGQSPNGMG